MTTLGKHFVSKRVIIYEIMSFVFVISLIWLDEILDIPHLFLGSAKTLLNWREALLESIIISIIGSIIVIVTSDLFSKMKYLEGILPVCSSCKRIRDARGYWHQIESYIRDRSEAEFSHGICPECAEKLYFEFGHYKK